MEEAALKDCEEDERHVVSCREANGEVYQTAMPDIDCYAQEEEADGDFENRDC